jgi:Rab GDP dissociation inhibitor
LVRVLVHTDVTKYLEFKAVDGSFVLARARVEKVPASDWEALKSPLMGLFEKRRAAKFFGFCQQFDAADAATWRGWDLCRMTMAELYAQFGLDVATIDFVGHAIALHRDDHYMTRVRRAAAAAPRVRGRWGRWGGRVAWTAWRAAAG